jgi:type IV pilus assembly protein PilQ
MTAGRTVPVALTGSPDAPWLRAAARPEAPRPPPATPQAERAARTIALDAQVPPSKSEGEALAGAPAQAQPKYTGEVISVNLKDVDLTDFFRLIHEVSGLNVVVDPSVTGKVTLALDSVPWDQALDLVLKNNGLGRILQGNVVRVAKLSTLAEEEESAAKFEQARLEAGPLVTVFRPLKYARALDTAAAQSTVLGMPPATSTPGLVTILKNLNGLLSKRGEVVADPRNNALIITDVPSQIPVIQSVVDKLDTKPKQISIEARIVQANSDFVRDLESAVNGGATNRSGTTVTGGATGIGASAQGNIPTPSAPGQPPPPRITVVQTAAAGFGAYAISNQAARYFINAALAAAETRARAKVISEPTIITQNNVLGKVSQGVQVPVQTNINNTVTTQFKDATLELDVTPQVTGDGNIFLVLYVQNDTPGTVFPGLGTSINTQSATTQVLVPDGGTVVFGGIKVTRRAKSATQVPGLGSVPILGNLFKSSQVNDNDQELLFFVTPKMLPG